MAYVGSICDQSTARKSAGAVLWGQNVFSVVAGNLSSVAAAQAALATNAAALSVCDQTFATQISRGYQIASNDGGSFASNYTTLYDSLPSSVGHQRAMISS